MRAIDTINRSPEAESIRWEAVRMVDELESRRGPFSLEEQNQVLRSQIGMLCQKRMLEELEPINNEVARIYWLIAEPIAPEIDQFRQSIIDRWQRIASELLG